jgi:hypothetical protein
MGFFKEKKETKKPEILSEMQNKKNPFLCMYGGKSD